MQKGLMWGSVVVAVAAAFALGGFEYYALVLVVLGLAMGYTNPIEDVATRVAMYVLAVLLPRIADNLDVFGVAGEYLNGILSQFAVVIAGVAIVNFGRVLKDGLMAAGNESDDGDDEAESDDGDDEAESDDGDDEAESDDGDDEAESDDGEAPSWDGDDSGNDDSDDEDDEAEGTRNV